MRAGCSGGGGSRGGYGLQRMCVYGGGKETRKGKKECVYQTRGSSATCTHIYTHTRTNIHTHMRIYIRARDRETEGDGLGSGE
jgi:hypothetical protein